MSDLIKHPADEFDAVRIVVEVLKGLKPDEQSRVLRWAQDRLGILTPAIGLSAGTAPAMVSSRPSVGDIRSFMASKNPTSDVQFVTAVAYYYAFEAPEGSRKSEITATDVKEATRLTDYKRLQRAIGTLHNAVGRGYLDKGKKSGTFRINSVGENLVALTLGPASVGANVTLQTSGKK
jgi:hypothetical protein